MVPIRALEAGCLEHEMGRIWERLWGSGVANSNDSSVSWAPPRHSRAIDFLCVSRLNFREECRTCCCQRLALTEVWGLTRVALSSDLEAKLTIEGTELIRIVLDGRAKVGWDSELARRIDQLKSWPSPAYVQVYIRREGGYETKNSNSYRPMGMRRNDR